MLARVRHGPGSSSSASSSSAPRRRGSFNPTSIRTGLCGRGDHDGGRGEPPSIDTLRVILPEDPARGGTRKRRHARELIRVARASLYADDKGEQVAMANFFKDNDDLQYYFDKGVDWDSLVRITEPRVCGRRERWLPHDRGSGRASIATSSRCSGSSWPPRSNRTRRRSTTEGVELHRWRGGVPGATGGHLREVSRSSTCTAFRVPRELGGMNAPMLALLHEQRVDGACRRLGDGGTMASMLASRWRLWSSQPTREAPKSIPETGRVSTPPVGGNAIEEIASPATPGAAWTSPSRVQAQTWRRIRTVGEQDAEGNWYVTGEKIFITSGHGKYHFVIARTEDSNSEDPMAGLEGLSMFLVKTYEDDENGHPQAHTSRSVGSKRSSAIMAQRHAASCSTTCPRSLSANVVKASSTC